MTNYFYDTEFHDDGQTIDLISIGIVADDGREYYAINVDCNFRRICGDDWLWNNVVQHLPTTGSTLRSAAALDRDAAPVKPKWVIANEVRDFILAREDPKLWAYYAAYDHVALAQLWGKMINLPDGIPMWTHDLMQLIEPLDGFVKPIPPVGEHHALDDAKWGRSLWRLATAHAAGQRSELIPG